jgi:hypothetical protein
MPDDRWTTWQAEQAGTNKLPGILTMFLVLGLLAALALALVAGPTTATAQGGDRRQAPTFCEEHRGQPAWDRICEETARRRR